MEQNTNTAKAYFEAFTKGNIEETESYFAKNGVVVYGSESPKPASSFYKETASKVAKVKFDLKGVFAAKDNDNVLIYFEHKMPDQAVTDAVDVVEFDKEGKITKLSVIHA